MNLINNIIEAFKVLFIGLPIYFYDSLFCKHEWEFESNIYGDPINMYGGRSWWRCKKCNQYQVREYLVKE